MIILFERNNVCYEGYNFGQKMLCAFFNASVSRTAGFTNFDLTQISESGYFLFIVLMFIGGCSGSTAGGIKISTFAVIVMGMWSVLRGRRDINIGKRRIESSLLSQALAIFMAYLTIIIVATLLICTIETGEIGSFRLVLFETVSALGTVGLSLGITPMLSVASKIIIIILMYMGRVGVITFALALGRRRSEAEIRLPLVDNLYLG